ncbi:MAG TPA: prepilin-type N-terminal cleavage/methylation domain-containing protein [Xanthobacteraceae bacterium]
MSRDRAPSAKQGFTLVEVLAALAIASVIVMATAALMHNVVLSFDRGANRASAGERLVLAAERLATDIGSARFVLQGTSPGALAAFVGGPTKITFIGAGIVDPAARREGGMPAVPEVISVAVEAGDDTTALVRRRGAWRDPRARLADVALRDEVVLVAGQFDAAFSFARMGPEGALSWSSSWAGEQTLPRLVKLSLRDRLSGVDLLGGAEFVIRSDASRACAQAGATTDCLANPAGPRPGAAPANSPMPTGGRR